jgi:formate hydrogenlyase subunit 4
MMEIAIGISQLLVIVLLAPFINALVHKVKCLIRGQAGPSLIQPYRDIIKLLKKKSVISETASWISKVAPYVVFSVSIVAAAFVPVFSPNTLFHFSSDVIGFVYLMALGTLFLTLYGLDQGSAFGGLGSSREVTIAALAEPAMMISIFTFCIMNGTSSMSEIFSKVSQHPLETFSVSSAFAIFALFMVAIAESARIPVDNPETHLELTMIHEAMILEASGRDLALMELGAWIKQMIFISFIASTLFPISGFVGFIWYLIKIFFIAFFIGLIEISNAKLRFFRVPDFLAVAFALSVISLVVHYLEV